MMRFYVFILTSVLTVTSSNVVRAEELYLICTIPLLQSSHHLVAVIDMNANTSSIKQYDIKVGASLYSSNEVPFFTNKDRCPNPTWDTQINEMIIQISTACAEGDDEEYLLEFSRATGSVDHYFSGTHIGRGRCVKAADRAF